MATAQPTTTALPDPTTPTAEPTTAATTDTTTRTTQSPTWDGSLPPLTTVWSMPETCGFTYDLDDLPTDGDNPTVYMDWTIDSDASTFSCYPPGMFEAGNSGTFSPARCPSGWYTVSIEGWEDKTLTRTGTCCSLSYSIYEDGIYCERSETGVIKPTLVAFSNSTHTYLPPSSNVTPLTSAILRHHKMVIFFEEKDQEILGVQDPDDLIAGSPSSSTSSGAGNLSLGAKIGIAIGVAVGLSLLLALAIWLFRRSYHRRRRKELAHQLGVVSLAGEETGAVPVTRQVDGPDPPPAYEASLSQASLDTVEAVTAEAELRVLKAQQEMIQQRIEEIELNMELCEINARVDGRRETGGNCGTI